MMCKDPAGRYQKPVHLIQHLMQVAEKVGAGADVPEGAMFLDAPLPGVPRFRPLLTIVLAVLALGVLLLLISLVPNPRGPGFVGAGNSSQPGDRKGSSDKGLSTSSYAIASEKQFQQAFEQGGQAGLDDEKDLVLTTGGMEFKFESRKSLQLNGGTKQKLQFKYERSEEGLPTNCLTLNLEAGSSVEFENIRFELIFNDTYPKAMIAIRGPGQATFKKCTFALVGSSAGKSFPKGYKVASLLIQNSANDAKNKPQVTLSECFWEQGQVAVAIEGPVSVEASNCAFGVHNAEFLMRGNCPKNKATNLPVSDLTLNQCSAFLVNGPAFRIDDEYFCTLNVTNCIFSNPTGPHEGQVIQQKKHNSLLVRYLGKGNVYHNLSDLLTYPTRAVDLRDLSSLASENGSDKDSLVLTKPLWADAEPLKKLQQGDPGRAFQIRQIADNKRVIGIKDFAGTGNIAVALRVGQERIAHSPGTQPEDRRSGRRRNEPAKRVSNHQGRIAALPKGGRLYIKPGKSREVPVDNVLFEQGTGDYEFMPYPNPLEPFQPVPVLVFTEKPDKSLFRLTQKFSGKLHFEDLEFMLDTENAERDASKSIGVVNLACDGQCSFKSCLFTLRRPASGLRLTVVTIRPAKNDNGDSMPMAKEAARSSFTDCMVAAKATWSASAAAGPWSCDRQHSARPWRARRCRSSWINPGRRQEPRRSPAMYGP